MDIREFIQANGITMTVEPAQSNPVFEGGGGGYHHWLVTLKRPFEYEGRNRHNAPVTKRGRKQMSLHYSMGWGHKGKPPTIEDVLDTLAADAALIENSRDLNDFMGAVGYHAEDVDRARRGYEATQRQTENLRGFLDDSALYEQLLWDTERE